MKLILERFKKFLSENEAPIELPTADEIALYHDKDIDNHELVIYKMTKFGPVVMAGCTIDVIGDEESPCIPETWQMSTVYTLPNYRRQGYGKLLYGLAFYLVNSEGAGLTSDHWTSTSDLAKNRSWNKLISRGEVTPRSTPEGHTEFDYSKETEDPLDDCEQPGKGPAATDNSLVLKKYIKFKPYYEILTQNHEDLMGTVNDRKQVEKQLIDDNTNNFDKSYGG